MIYFFFSSRRRHTRYWRDWSSDVCSSDLNADNAGPDSRRLAEAIQRHMLAALGHVGHAAVDRGAKEDLLAGKPYGHFFSLRGGMPSALGEPLFLSNPTEAALLLREDARDAVARGYAGGILEYFAAADLSATP